MVVINIRFIKQSIKYWLFSIPKNQLKYVAKCVVRSLCETDLIDTPYYMVKVRIDEKQDDNKLHFIIDGVTSRDKVLIINSFPQNVVPIYDEIEYNITLVVVIPSNAVSS